MTHPIDRPTLTRSSHAPTTRAALVLLAGLASACGDSAYKLINVPHCAVPADVDRSSFAETVRWIYVSGDANGIGSLTGTWPTAGIGNLDALRRNELLLAVVSCAPQAPSIVTGSEGDPLALAAGLTADKVPDVCPGQQVMFHGTVTATDDAAAREKGYSGVLRFPDLALTCKAGTLARTTSADIEPRPQ